jgi:diguanylate cyclase (GGDEF)-like protein/PAS domain S-box-containing protein
MAREIKPQMAISPVAPTDGLLRALVSHLPYPAAVIGRQGRVLGANGGWKKLNGAPPACLEDIVDPDAAERVKALLQAASGEQASFACRIGAPEGLGAGRVLLTAARLVDGVSDLALVQLMPLDSDEAEQREVAQRESRWSHALEGAGQGVWDHDLIRNRVYHSPAWYRMRGFEPGNDIEAELGPWIERVHPDDRPLIASSIERQDRGELRFNAFQYRERHRNGGWIWILSRGRPVERLPNGAVARIVGTDTDITALKQIESQLADEKERLRVTLQGVADGIIASDAQGYVTFLNPAAEALTGWSLSEAVGKPAVQVLTLLRDDGSIPPCPVLDCITTGEALSVDDSSVLVHASGDIRDIRLTASPLKNSSGALMGAVVVFQDITRSRNLQRELAHSASHDLLTGLPNRAAFDQALQGAAALAREENRQHALCYIDLDYFKQVNDTAGHAAGDELLKHIADLIRQSCRNGDFAARIGGDEFVLLLLDCSLDDARIVCEKLVQAISRFVFTWEGQSFTVGASVGITAVTFREPSTSQLTKQADAACYAAKRDGRGRVRLFDNAD